MIERPLRRAFCLSGGAYYRTCHRTDPPSVLSPPYKGTIEEAPSQGESQGIPIIVLLSDHSKSRI